MPRGKSKEQLAAELNEANDYIEELEGKLDDIAGIAVEDEEEEGDEEDELSDHAVHLAATSSSQAVLRPLSIGITLAGNVFLLWEVHCAGIVSGAARLWKSFRAIVNAVPGSREIHSPSRRNRRSRSPRNHVHLQPGTTFTFAPQLRSPSPGIRNQRKIEVQDSHCGRKRPAHRGGDQGTQFGDILAPQVDDLNDYSLVTCGHPKRSVGLRLPSSTRGLGSSPGTLTDQFVIDVP